jgi:hypothetical protein
MGALLRDLSAIIRPIILTTGRSAKQWEFQKRYVLGWLLLARGISFTDQAPSAVSPDTIFWWQAGGISGAASSSLRSTSVQPVARPHPADLNKTETNAAQTNAAAKVNQPHGLCLL